MINDFVIDIANWIRGLPDVVIVLYFIGSLFGMLKFRVSLDI